LVDRHNEHEHDQHDPTVTVNFKGVFFHGE
jgi:hypothetical protein